METLNNIPFKRIVLAGRILVGSLFIYNGAKLGYDAFQAQQSINGINQRIENDVNKVNKAHQYDVSILSDNPSTVEIANATTLMEKIERERRAIRQMQTYEFKSETDKQYALRNKSASSSGIDLILGLGAFLPIEFFYRMVRKDRTAIPITPASRARSRRAALRQTPEIKPPTLPEISVPKAFNDAFKDEQD